MGRVTTIARRTFLIGSVAVAGGVAFGAYMYKRPGENPLMADLEDGEAVITPYVKIDPEGVTLITPRTAPLTMHTPAPNINATPNPRKDGLP